MLKLDKAEKTFPGVRALKAVDFEIKRGEIVGLVGENGAGKSTLMKVLYGAYQLDGGAMTIDGAPVRFANPRAAMERGVGMVFQEQSLIPNLRVMENIFLGFEKQFINGWGMMKWKEMAEAARRQLAKVHLDVDPYETTQHLSFAQRQMVELAKVLTLEERVEGDLVILLDEPTSVLSKDEVAILFRLVRELRSRASFIFVSHRLDEVIDLADRIYVLKDGAVVDVVDSAHADAEGIQHKMVGREIDRRYYREHKQEPYDKAAPLVVAEGLTQTGHYEDVSFTLHRGEVLTLVGTEGSGNEAVMRTVFGLERPDSGRLSIKGEEVRTFTPTAGVARGVGYIPRERKIEGIVGGMSVAENMTLSQLGRYSTGAVLALERERATAREWVEKLAVKTPSVDSWCANLSGGNQQKVVLAKWRSGGSEVILLDHPTRGLDIGAKEDVYEMVRAMSADGCGVLLIADTLEEAIGLSHTILVMKDGRVQERFDCAPGAKPTPYDLVHHMI
jgi:ribose transport system ATP-binding protein